LPACRLSQLGARNGQSLPVAGHALCPNANWGGTGGFLDGNFTNSRVGGGRNAVGRDTAIDYPVTCPANVRLNHGVLIYCGHSVPRQPEMTQSMRLEMPQLNKGEAVDS
jgi:hypothetical protein